MSVKLLTHQNRAALLDEAACLIKKELCMSNGPAGRCGCITCRHIDTATHHAVRWITPEGLYVLKDIEPIFKVITFALPPGEKFFFVMADVENLSATCGNKLLKTLEEPPDGYNFILLAKNVEPVLPTIKSRCHIINVDRVGHESVHMHPLVELFTSTRVLSPSKLEEALRESAPDHSESVELLDEIVSKLKMRMLKKTITDIAATRLKILESFMKRPPGQGGAKLFWKNIFLALFNK
ncbi:hypothetical protein HOD08_04355 [bacterium]|nr:hypothetical protein [bacterium]